MSSRRNFKPWAFILPGVIAGGVVLGVPVVQAFWTSLHRLRMYRMHDQVFVGLDNYARLLQDPLFHLSVRSTVVFSFGCTILSVIAGLAVASVMSTRGIRGTSAARFFMAFYLVPFVATQVVVGMMGRLYVWEPEYGLVNFLLGLFGADGPMWLISRDTAMWATIVTNAWRLTPLAVLIFYAALATIPEELLESAEVDGAGGWKALALIKLPLIRYHIGFIALIQLTSAFREFDTVFALTGGGPGRTTNVLSLLVYNEGISNSDMGMANAISFTMLIIVAVLSLVYMRLARLGDLGN
ncbi:MAG: sugar ABC transporter permease [Trueperaceae bacterium]|nr:sugar ABC transporter permease [Trueperaceae bacterium]